MEPILPEKKPSIGRMVHYVAYGTPGGEYEAGAHRSAIVTEVPEGPDAFNIIGLAVFNPTGIHFNNAHYSEDGAPGTWHWPEYAA